MTTITRQAYREELATLRQEIAKMGRAVDDALERSVRALLNNDAPLAHQVMSDDDIIDAMTIAIEDRCMLLIARQQPLARDLRIIATGLKISTDLERIGDHAHDIAQLATELDTRPFLDEAADIQRMAQAAGQMLQDSIQAYNTCSVRLAEKICAADDAVDGMYAKMFRDLSRFVANDPAAVKQATQMIFIARYLERIADHATNIAEWVIYLVTAERIRKAPKFYPSDPNPAPPA